MQVFAKFLAAASAVALAGLACAHDYAAGALKIEHPWSRPTVAGQPAGGAFMTVHNGGATADRLLGASTDAADHVELHTMAMDGNVMRMREVPAIDLPAGQTVALQPGQFHMMLQGLKRPLAAGERVPMTLKFEKAGEVKVELAVQGGSAGASAPGAMVHQH